MVQSETFKREVDARERPWYQAALKAGGPVWTEVYPSVSKSADHALLTNFSQPIFDQNRNLLGVTSVILDLTQISNFLQTINLSPSSQIYIIQPTGELVGTSDGQAPVTISGDQVNRLRAIDSKNPLIKASAAYLKQYFEQNLSAIHQVYQLDFSSGGKTSFPAGYSLFR